MILRSLLSFAAAGIFLASTPIQASAASLQAIKDRGSITIAVDFTHPPYGMLNDKAEQTGMDYELAKLLAEDLGVKLELQPVTGPNRIPFLLTGKADIVIASFTINEERAKVIAFSRPYATHSVHIVAPSSISIQSPQDLSGKSVAVARGATADLELTKAIKDVANVDVHRYLDEATAQTAVSTGQQDIFAAGIADAITVQVRNPDRNFELQLQLSEDPLGIGLRLEDTELKAWIDNWVLDNLKNGKINDIQVKYFNHPVPKWLLD